SIRLHPALIRLQGVGGHNLNSRVTGVDAGSNDNRPVGSRFLYLNMIVPDRPNVVPRRLAWADVGEVDPVKAVGQPGGREVKGASSAYLRQLGVLRPVGDA